METSTEITEIRALVTSRRRHGHASAERIEAVYRTEGERFRRLATAVAGREAAGDVVQEAFALALRKRRSWRGDGPLEAWLWRLVLNAARDADRRRLRGDRLAVRLLHAARRDPVPAVAFDDELHGPLRRLPARQRDCVVLRYYGDLAYEAIAEVMGIESGTVGALLSKAHTALRAELTEEDPK